VLLVRPDFTDTLGIRHGRHPILDKMAVEPPVANSTVKWSGLFDSELLHSEALHDFNLDCDVIFFILQLS